MEFPKMALIEQAFNSQKVEDIPVAVIRELAALNLSEKVKKGDTVAITAGV